MASPGALSAAVLLTGRAKAWIEDASIIVMIGLCLIITYIAMRAADVLVRCLGQTGADVVGRMPASPRSRLRGAAIDGCKPTSAAPTE